MPKSKEIKGVQQYVRAQIQKNSFNKETRSFDVTFVTETPVRTYNYDIGFFNEILSCDPANIRMQRAERGLPVFDSHYPRTAMVQLGRGSNIKFVNKQGTATIILGARADEALISDIENGIIDGISVGYNVFRYMPEGVPAKGEVPTFRAVDWEPGEISFAPVQADPNSHLRSKDIDGDHTVIIDNYSLKNENDLKTIAEIRAKASDEQKARLDAILLIARAAKLSDEKAIELFECEKTIDVIRSENPELIQDAPPATPSTPVVDINKIRQEANEAQKARIDAILKSTRAAKLSDTEAIEFINSDKPIEEIRQAVIEKFVAGDPKKDGNHGGTIGKEAIEKKREACEKALLNRVMPSVFKLDPKDGNNEYRGLSLIEIVREFATENGINVRGLDRIQIADLVFGKSRTQSTSDFPLLLENLADKLLRADYKFAPEYWQLIARETSVQDFKEKGLYQVDSVNGMKEIQEAGEIKYTHLVEAKQKIKVKKYAEGIKFTREMFINDDLNAFALIPNRFILDWNTLRGDLVWALLTGNVTMDDTKALFHADHKNVLTGSGSALDDAGLTAALKLFRDQKGLDGVRKIRVSPRYLIVSTDQEIVARKLLVPIIPNSTAVVNVWENAYTPIVESRLTGNVWYLAADPSQIEGLYYCYLNGNSGLRSNRVDDFDSDSIKFAVRGEFGVNAIDYRGWLRANGGTTQG